MASNSSSSASSPSSSARSASGGDHSAPAAKSPVSNATKFQQARIASKLAAAANADIPCMDCADQAEVQAVIIFPSLGTPYVAPVDEKMIKLYILVEDDCVEGLNHFGMIGSGENRTATLAWYFINRHLRLTPFSESTKTSAKIKGSGLYSSDAVAKNAIKVWYHGRHGSGEPQTNTWLNVLRDHDGNIVATLRPSAIDFFVKSKAAYGAINPAHKLDAKEADVSNKELKHLFEVELSIAGLKVPPQPNRVYSIAWFVTCVYAKAKGENGKPVLPGVTHWEHQDKLVYDFIAMMQKKKQHFATPFTFDVPGIRQDALSAQGNPNEGKRIKSYHPVVFKSTPSLKIGHLSDVHVNSRHFALAASQAEVIPKHSGAIGPKLANSFVALRELFDSMRDQKADALFITGDLIDFNHNFNPSKLNKGAPKEQWQQYDLSKQFSKGMPVDANLYPRGLDDMLMYSLVKYSCMHDCPVFITTGNHEAYDVPYGIAPRLNGHGMAQTYEQTLELRRLQKDREVRTKALEDAGKPEEAKQLRESREPGEPVMPARLLEVGNSWLPDDPVRSGLNAGEAVGSGITKARNALPGWLGGREGKSDFQQKMEGYKAKIEAESKKAYAYSATRANAGVPADHNLTIYEACMAYGPSYGQLVKAWNFTPSNFDWFFMLFTPLADYALPYGKAQTLIGLDWGETEIMVNVDMSYDEAKTAASTGSDKTSIPDRTGKLDQLKQKAAGAWAEIKDNLQSLPRADKSMTPAQRQLVENALKRGSKKNVLCTHFTLVNYDMPVSYSKPSRAFALDDKTFNEYTKGSFSQGRDWLLGKLINNGIHYALSGHSHRAGVYRLDNAKPAAATTHAYEPATPDDNTSAPVHQKLFSSPEATRIIVSSSGGPIGVQNLRGELYGWNLKAPSGTLLNTQAHGLDECRRIEVTPAKAPFTRPRFCVALDYLVVEKGLSVISFIPKPGLPGEFMLLTAHVQEAAHYLEKVEFYAWALGADDDGAFKVFTTELSPTAAPIGSSALAYSLKVTDWPGLLKTLPPAISKASHAPSYFARLHFSKALGAHPLYKHYNFDDPWIFPVTITSSGISRTAGELGEVPNFKWMKTAMRDDYFYDTGAD